MLRSIFPVAASIVVACPATVTHAGFITSGSEFQQATAPATVSETPAADSLVGAWEALQAGDPDACVRRIEAARRQAAFLPPTQVILGRLYLLAGAQLAARAALDRAAQGDPDHPDVSLAYAELALAEGRWADARLHLERTMSLAVPSEWPTAQARRLNALCRRHLADVCLQQGQYEAAQGLLLELRAEDDGDDDPELSQKLGIALIHSGQLEAGLEALVAARQGAADLPPPELTVAGILSAKDPGADVEPWLRRAVEKYPDDDRAPAECGAWLLVNNRPEAALELLEQATRRFPESFALHLHTGQCLFQLGRYEEAEPYLERAFLLEPASTTALEHLCLCLLEQSDQRQHVRAAHLAGLGFSGRESLPASAKAVLAWARARNGDADSAEALRNSDSAGGSLNPLVEYLRGRTLELHDDTAQAQQAYLTAAEAGDWHLYRSDARLRITQ